MLVHGAGSGPWVFDDWEAPPELSLVPVDLHAGLDVATASMDDYARVLASSCAGLPRPLALCGWSMGGLVVMMAAAEVAPEALVLLEPSPPAEVQGTHEVADARGVFDAEEVYGRFPKGVRARPESLRARADRKRGISVPPLPERSLVVFGDEFEDERGRAVAAHYGIRGDYFSSYDHWELVIRPEVSHRVVDYALGR